MYSSMEENGTVRCLDLQQIWALVHWNRVNRAVYQVRVTAATAQSQMKFRLHNSIGTALV